MWASIYGLTGCERITQPGNHQFCLFRAADSTAWLVGPYDPLTRFATSLRGNAALRDFCAAKRIRLGFRNTDVPPADVVRQERYGPALAGKDAGKDFSGVRVHSLVQPVTPQNALLPNRKSDLQQNVKTFWATQTPQSHHIVEFNNLETLGFSKKIGSREQDYLQLPAVLLAAEMHQRYISSILKPAQQLGTSALRLQMADVYRRLYQARGPLFAPLWNVTAIILAEAGLLGG